MWTPIEKESILKKIEFGIIYGIIASFPITYLGIKHGVNSALYSLTLMSIISWLIFTKQKWDLNLKNLDGIIFLSFSSLFLTTLLNQIARSDFYLGSFDGPSRLLFAGMVFLYLKNKPLPYISILKIAIPTGILVLLAIIYTHPQYSAPWGGRFASKFVDPNSLGSQTLILSLICLFLISKNNSPFENLLLATGLLASIYISIFAGSRGGWIAAPFILGLWVYLKSNTNNKKPVRKLVEFMTSLFFIGLIFYLAYKNIPMATSRVDIAIQEIIAALTKESFNTSVGTRIGIWKIATQQLVPLAGFFGFGENALGVVVGNLNLDPQKYAEPIFHLTNTGPHSDLLAKLLTMGYLGGIAYLATIFVPWIICWKNRFNVSNEKLAAQAGLCFISGVFLCGFSNEMLSLKYLSSFYGLLIATLLAVILRVDPRTNKV